MREMKDSGIEWIGNIPVKWTLTRLGGLYSLRNEKVSDKDYPPLSVTNKGILPQLENAAKTNDGDNRKLVKIGDFAINSRSDRKGSCGISKYDGSVSLINIVLTPRQSIDSNYYENLFHTSQFGEEYYKWGHGIVNDLWTTGWQEMKKIIVPMPPIEEQHRIADYLDARCAEIDSLTADIKKQIEVLEQYKKSVITEAVTKGLDPDAEMKDSGIEWIGDIPVHWHISKIKYISSFSPSCNLSSLKQESLVGYSPMDCIKDGYQFQLSKNYFDLPKSLTPYQNGDIVMAKVTPCFENGNIAIMENTPSGIGFGSSELFVFRTTNIKQKYLFYWLRNSKFKDVAASTMTGTGGLKRVSSSFVSNSDILVPPNQEQESIVDYLDEKCNEIDRIISAKQDQLETLSEYKKSLIYEYVTGKKEVPAK